MAEVLELSPTIIHTGPEWQMDDDQFFAFCARNKDLRIERSSNLDILIMSPEAGSSGGGNSRLIRRFDEWAEREGSGRAFGNSTGFTLPNRSVRSPDIAWVRNSRLRQLTKDEWEKFLPLCPDFVLELRSPSDRLTDLKTKMREYIDNGARLGWLLDPFSKQVQIYRPDSEPETLENPSSLSGEPILCGFVLNVQEIWQATRL
jgi:Uma2 family endonuclease